MTIQLGWDLLILAAMVAAALVFLGAVGEYLWHSTHHRRH